MTEMIVGGVKISKTRHLGLKQRRFGAPEAFLI